MTDENKRSLRKSNSNEMFLFEVLAILYIMHNRMPIVGHYMPSIVYLGIFALLFILVRSAFTRKGAYVMLGFLAVSMLEFILKLANIVDAAVFLYGELQVYLYGLIAMVFIIKEDPKRSRRIFGVIMAMYVITCVTTIIGNDEYPMASRMLATNTLDAFLREKYVKANIGGFSFAYGLVLLTPLILYLTKSKKINILLGIGMILLIGATLLSMEYGMAVLLYAVSVVVLLIPKLSVKKLIILMVIVLIFVLVFGNLTAELFEQISLSVDSDALQERFMVIAQVLRGEDKISSDSANNRTELYGNSWKAFINSSFLGAWGDKRIGSPGGHSFVLDAMGHFGLFGIVGLIFVFTSLYKVVVKPYKRQDYYPYLVWVYLMGVVLMALNPHSYGVVFLMLVPLFAHAFGNKQ